MKILTVTGHPRVGKDSFCKYACESRPTIYTYSIIDGVKQKAKMLGWDGVKDNKGRKFLSDLKDSLSEYNDYPVQSVLELMKKRLEISGPIFKADDRTLFLIQMREPHDIERWKQEFGARAVYISRPGVGFTRGNHADDNVLLGKYDYTLENRSTLWDWKKTTFDFINMVLEENWESHI